MQLKKKDIKEALRILAADANVFVPGDVNGVERFYIWDKESDIDLGGANTVLPPKDILFPKTEKMYSYSVGENTQIKEVIQTEKNVIFGIRPCDVRSIECMDAVFLGTGYEDSFYARKRSQSLLIAAGCTECGENCFCESMGLSPNKAEGADIFLKDAGDAYVVIIQSTKGKAVGELWRELLMEGGEAEADVHNTLRVEMSEELSRKLPEMFEHPIWDEVTKPCLGCGTCTYVCPSCYCFDINSEKEGAQGTQFRCWDSCMFSDYNRVAGGYNPRPTKKERVRNRYLHKLAFFYDRFDMQLCVGCGRCINKCPAHMDIADFINLAAKEVEERD